VTLAFVIVAIGLPALAFVVWPLARRGGGRRFLAVPPDQREQLTERKRQILGALRELAFEHESGHVGDADYADLRARYEAEAGDVFTALDRLGAAPEPKRAPAPPARGWRHPAALAAGGVALLVFGIAIGVGIVRNTAPDPNAGMAPPGSRPLANIQTVPPTTDAPAPGQVTSAPRALPPGVLQGMLDAARASLFEGRYSEAIAAYQAVLKRDPKNVDAITHLGLIVAIGGHADSALETFERALAIDPNYLPALLYRGQILYAAKHDADGAIRSWEKFLSLKPSETDRVRVEKLIAEAKAKK